MRERCGGILEDVCERVSLDEGVMEILIIFSDDQDETDEVSGGALEGSRIKNSDSRNMSPAGVSDGSELAEVDDGDCVGERGIIVFDPGDNPRWTSGTHVDSDRQELNDMDETALGVGDSYGEKLACSMEQDQASIGGLSAGISEEELVDPPWASNVGEMTFES